MRTGRARSRLIAARPRESRKEGSRQYALFFCWLRLRSFSYSFEFANRESTRSIAAPMPKGLIKTAAAPREVANALAWDSRIAVVMTKGESGKAPTVVNSRTTSTPFMPGSIRSRKTRSGLLFFAAATPSRHAPTRPAPHPPTPRSPRRRRLISSSRPPCSPS